MIEFSGIKISIDSVLKFIFNAKKDESKRYLARFDERFYPWLFRDLLKFLKDGKFKSGDGFTHIGFVFGTSRHESPCDHPGFISDALYIPEIISLLYDILRGELKVHSFLDADLFDFSGRAKNELSDFNLILTGDGEVNYCTARLLERRQHVMEVKYEKPNEPFFHNAIKIEPSKAESHMFGSLHLLANPWSLDRGLERFVIFAGGIGHLGTVSSLWLLEKLLAGREKLIDRHTYIVKGREKKYSSEFDHWGKLGIDPEGYPKGKLSNVEEVDIVEAFPKNK